MRPAAILLMLVAGAAAAPAGAADEPVRILLEAEDFDVERPAQGAGWSIVEYGDNYFASTFAITFLSRQACLGAPEDLPGDVVATEVVSIPADDEYDLLARYEQPYDHLVEFTVEVRQDGVVRLARKFGARDAERYWAFSQSKPAPMKWWFWGGGDNIVWERGGAVRLRRGEATVRLVAGPQGGRGDSAERRARRNVDVLCLTNDSEGLARHAQSAKGYLPYDGLLVQAGGLYVRVTNPEDAKSPCVPVLRPYPSGQMSPFWVHTRDWGATKLVRAGRVEQRVGYVNGGPRATRVREELLAPRLAELDFDAVAPELGLRPGESSGWAPLGHLLDALHVSRWLPGAEYARRTKDVDLIVEFAVPDGRGGLRQVKKARVTGRPGYPASPLAFEIPGDVSRDPAIRTQVEALRGLHAALAASTPTGRPPKRFPVHGIMGFSRVVQDRGEIGRAATELALLLGDDTLTPATHAHAADLGVAPRRTAQAGGIWPTALPRLTKMCDAYEAKGLLGSVRLVSFGDEMYVPPAPIDASELAAFLGREGVEYEGEIAPTSLPTHPLYYYSRLCAIDKGIERWAAATRYVASRTDGAALAGVNYGPAPHNEVDEIHFVRPLRRGAVSVAWTEDYVWQMPEVSPQITGYRTSGLRAGARDRDLPIVVYTMPHSPGNTPRDLRLSYFTALAHGMRIAHFYCATPSAVGTSENYVATDDVDMFRTIRELTYETGEIEDYVLDGRVRAARVALLLSAVDDIRNPSSISRGGHANLGRKAIYYALRHAQVPVDFVTEDDVIDGSADAYDLIYVTQEHLHSKAVTALGRWVRAGGTLVGLCGGGFRDEFGRDGPAAGELWGVAKQWIEKDETLDVFHVKQDLPRYEPLDRAGWSARGGVLENVPVVLWRQTLEPDAASVLGRYSDGSPAVVSRRLGKGRTVLFGFMAGLAYVRSALERRPWDRGATDRSAAHYLPTAWDPELRRALVDDHLPEDFERPVVCDAPLVETTCIDAADPRRLAVPLLNYSGARIDRLGVRIAGVPQAKGVRSVRQGRLVARYADGALHVELPLDVTDVLLVDL